MEKTEIKTAEEFIRSIDWNLEHAVTRGEFKRIVGIVDKALQFRSPVSQQLTKERVRLVFEKWFNYYQKSLETKSMDRLDFIQWIQREDLPELSCPDAQKEIEELKSALTSKESDVENLHLELSAVHKALKLTSDGAQLLTDVINNKGDRQEKIDLAGLNFDNALDLIIPYRNNY